MTPPENTERRGTGGGATETNSGDVAPPWQRVAKDTGGETTGADSDGFGDRWSAGQLSTQDTTYLGQQQGSGNAEETQFVTGSAANRLFGGQQETAQQPRGGYETQPQGSGKSRSTPVSALRRPGRGPRRASLQIKRFDPWSVLKLSLVLGVAMFLVWLVAVGVLYTVLDGMGVWDKVNGTYTSLVQGDSAESAGEPLISAGRVFLVATVVGAINIVLISALTTVSAFIYNVSADLAGGLEVTLSERE
ncbi:DUF3566 domain-containing protein [Prauserella muralis]|uniref:Uncharacterized protein n=1 Tax=Prauserella muralis TaxID=588067 RepID=A0A2V4B8W3_9PSEU|nr:DUF3566 domain-containing protein [Prauserella muralis]PXY31680.1 hypothetical protein BAY60_04770 [Prauserella muralis]TWE13944.1 transmembrane protein DUF3566 [Prauserella muralis]